MKYFTHTLALTGLVATLGTGALAQDADPATVTCGDFMAMSAEDQTAAMDAVKAAQMDTDAATSTDSAASPDSATSTDGVATDSDATSSDTAVTESDTAPSTDTSSGNAAVDPEMQALMTSCEGNDEALVMDQMGSM